MELDRKRMEVTGRETQSLIMIKLHRKDIAVCEDIPWVSTGVTITPGGRADTPPWLVDGCDDGVPSRGELPEGLSHRLGLCGWRAGSTWVARG